MVNDKSRIRKLQEELSELEGVVMAEFHPLTALRIAGSIANIALSTQREEDITKALRALETAKTIYRQYGEGSLVEPLNLTHEMEMELGGEYPSHYLLLQE